MGRDFGSLVKFLEVKGVRQVNHLVIESAWVTVDDASPMLVEYDNERQPRVQFSPYARADEAAPPRECVVLTGQEFLSILVWLARQGLLEDVGLVSEPAKTTSEQQDNIKLLRIQEDGGRYSCPCAVDPARETERIQAIAEWGVAQEMARRESESTAR